jgi:hypothetical protein
MLACADEAKENVVASISDDDTDGIFYASIRGTTTGEFWDRVTRRKTLLTERSNGRIVVRPADPITAREQRGDRAALEKLFAKAGDQVWAKLDDVAEFAASNLNCRSLQLAFYMPYHALVNYNASRQKQYESLLRPLQLYACLTPSERQKLRNGESLSVASISPKAKEVLAAIIFEPGGAVLDFAIDGEPTELMPLGLSNDLLLTATVNKSVVLAQLPDAGEPTMPSTPISPREIAQGRWSRNYDDNPYAREIPELVRVLIGNRLEWKISLHLAGKPIGSVSLADDSVPKGSSALTMESLPQNVKDVLEKAYQDYLKEMGGGG